MDNRNQKPFQAKSVDNVWNSAMYHLGMRDMTEKELRVKLNNKTDKAEWIEEVIARCFDYGFLKTDKAFALHFCEMCFSGEYGSQYIKRKLLDKGIAEPLVFSSISETKSKLEINERDLIARRLMSVNFESTSKEKVINDLTKKGFSHSDITSEVKQHADFAKLRTKAEIKGSKADLEQEIKKLFRKGKGKRAIKLALQQKHIATDCFDTIISKLERDCEIDFYESALDTLSKKSLDLSDYAGKSKAFSYLGSRGFDSEQIKYAIENLSN
ncbi:RecX family transcriptional regulator [Vibrio owensii]|uniref:RecX family transcriptional regulator n=1 Tax=Vibrio owensii TaxID=696485 RepID=UPI003CC6181D